MYGTWVKVRKTRTCHCPIQFCWFFQLPYLYQNAMKAIILGLKKKLLTVQREDSRGHICDVAHSTADKIAFAAVTLVCFREKAE